VTTPAAERAFRVLARSLPVLLQAYLAYRSWSSYRRWPRLQRSDVPQWISPVSVIVPARDEADNLMRLLPSLLCLDPPPLEIIIVDDRSGDETARIAAGFGARVVSVNGPPEGWSGKNWACRAGRVEAGGEWLLFTDADTWHAPESLGFAMAAADATRADLLSLLTGQECGSFWERLVLPFAHGHYFAAAAPEWANDDRAPTALANGQYLLVRGEAYDRVGGHAVVKGSLGEDVDFARAVRRVGGRVRVYRAESLVRVRMYRSFSGMQTGFRKYLATYIRAYAPHGALIAASTALAGLPLLRLVGMVRGRASIRSAAVAYAIGLAGFLPWVRWFGVPPAVALLQPLAYAVFQVIAIDATVRSLIGLRVSWKGRRYRA
jgi:chlorobactene glucosyltransferase